MEAEKRIWMGNFILVIIGALNWGSIGIFNIDLVAYIFGAGSKFSHVIYTLVGIAALYLCFKSKHVCCEITRPVNK